MKTFGNQKPLAVMIFLLLPFTMALSIVAEEKKHTQFDMQWDMDFFVPSCPGMILPEKPAIDSGSTADFNADDIKNPSTGSVLFKGNVELKQGGMLLRADEAQLDKNNKTFNAQGAIRYQSQHIRIAAQAINLNFAERSGEVNNTRFQLTGGSMRGEAAAISLQAEQPISITDVGFTSCPPGNESWLFQSSKVEIDPDTGRGEAEDVVLRINDLPVFYLPFISFPVDDRRQTGFLFPSIGNSSRNGLALDLPWYWNIARDKDATFYAKYLSKRGLMFGAEYRQLTKNTATELYAEYLPNDTRGVPGKEDRFFYHLNTDYSSAEHWRGKLDLGSVSDDDYFYDFGGNYDSGNRNHLRRIGQFSFNDEHLSFTGIFSKDQLLNTAEDPYSRLPQLRLSFLYPAGIAGLTTNLHMEATAFRHLNAVEAERLIIVPEIELPMQWLSGYIKPQLKFNYRHYAQDDPANILPDSVSSTIPIFSIDSAMLFERTVEYNQQSFMQTLEPRLFYLYAPERQQNDIALFDTTGVNNGVDSLFRENRYSGLDRIGDSNQLSLAITSRFYEQNSGRERMRLTMGRAYYLADRRVNFAIPQNGSSAIDLGVDSRANSALITNIQLDLYDHWWLKSELEYDDSERRTEKGVLGLQYLSTGLALNLRHRLNRNNDIDDLEQAEISFSWQVSDDLSFVGRWQQDIRKNRTIDSFAGLEYESCCWAIRLVARRYLNVRLDQSGNAVPGADEFNNGIYLEFILKGMTSIGNGLKLENDIQGYENRFKNY